MATCLHCSNELTGRNKVCDACKKRVARKPGTKRARPTHAVKRSPAKRPPARKAATKKTTKRVAYPEGLGPRGRKLWSSLNQIQGTPAGELALEACRMADRLETLDSVLRGGPAWIELVEAAPDSGISVVKVDQALDKARALAISFKTILGDLGVVVAPTADPSEPTAPANPLDELNRRREEKKAAGK